MKKNLLAALVAGALSLQAMASESQLTITVTDASGAPVHTYSHYTGQVEPIRLENTVTTSYLAEYFTRQTKSGEVTEVVPGTYKTGYVFDLISLQKPDGQIYVMVYGTKSDLEAMHDIEGATAPEISEKKYKALETLKAGSQVNIRLGCETQDKKESCDFTFNVKAQAIES